MAESIQNTETSEPNAPPLEEISMDTPPPYSPFPNLSENVNTNISVELEHAFNKSLKLFSGKKLGHMDFVPRIIQKRLLKDDLYDTQTDLINRVNVWLEEHPGLEVISCETITWFANSYKDIFSDSSICSREGDVFSKSTYIRGLRLWFVTDKIPSVNTFQAKIQTIQCETHIAQTRERFSQLVRRVNKIICGQTCRIMKVEMVKFMVREGLVCLEATHWEDGSLEKKTFVWALRIFSCLTSEPNNETIGYQDFLPDCLKRSRENRGYEVFSDIMDKASRWLAQQRLIRFCNLQTVSMKIKEGPQFEERCKFTEHSMWQTNYLKMIRAFFLNPNQKPPCPPPPRISYKTFVPVRTSPVDVKSKLPCYEPAKSLVERINEWLRITGASMAGIETVAMTMSSDAKLQMLGAEATFDLLPPTEEPFKQLFFIRLYLDGDYHEPPAAIALVSPPRTPFCGATSAAHLTSLQSPARYVAPSNSFHRLH